MPDNRHTLTTFDPYVSKDADVGQRHVCYFGNYKHDHKHNKYKHMNLWNNEKQKQTWMWDSANLTRVRSSRVCHMWAKQNTVWHCDLHQLAFKAASLRTVWPPLTAEVWTLRITSVKVPVLLVAAEALQLIGVREEHLSSSSSSSSVFVFGFLPFQLERQQPPFLLFFRGIEWRVPG